MIHRGIADVKRNKVRLGIEIRTGCEVFIHINRINDTDEWIVGLVNVTHNHALVTPLKHRYFRTNKEILVGQGNHFSLLKPQRGAKETI